MSRFYFQWFGNKRLELGHVDAVVDWSQFDTVVEPFCGSAALSLDLWARGGAHNYVLNDTDVNLIGLLCHIKAAGTSDGLYQYCRERLTAEDWEAHQRAAHRPMTPEEYFYYSRVRSGAFSRKNRAPEKWPSLTRGPRQVKTDELLASPRSALTLGDWRACVDRHKDDPRALIFLDPPYFSSFNQEYYGMDGARADEAGHIKDGTALFVEILEYLETCAATVVVITNSCSLLDFVYKKFVRERYLKLYGSGSMKLGPDGEKRYVRNSTHHLVLVGGGRPSWRRVTPEQLAEINESLAELGI